MFNIPGWINRSRKLFPRTSLLWSLDHKQQNCLIEMTIACTLRLRFMMASSCSLSFGTALQIVSPSHSALQVHKKMPGFALNVSLSFSLSLHFRPLPLSCNSFSSYSHSLLFSSHRCENKSVLKCETWDFFFLVSHSDLLFSTSFAHVQGRFLFTLAWPKGIVGSFETRSATMASLSCHPKAICSWG